MESPSQAPVFQGDSSHLILSSQCCFIGIKKEENLKYQDNTTKMLYASRQLDLSEEEMVRIVQSTQKVEEAGGFPHYFEVFSRPLVLPCCACCWHYQQL